MPDARSPRARYRRGVNRTSIPGIGAIQSWTTDRRMFVDVVFAVLMGVLSAADAAGVDPLPGHQPADLFAYTLIGIAAVSLIWRRRAPITVLTIVSAIMLTYWSRDHGSFLALLGLPALYSVAMHSSDRRRAWASIGIACAVLLVGAGVTVLDVPGAYQYFNAVSMAAYLVGAVAAGIVMRNRSKIFVDTQRRAEMAEADRVAEAQRAVVTERQRIAREMHDVVAHGMSVIAVQAAAGREIVHSDPDRTAKVLEHIEDVGRESLVELRRMLGVLRHTDDQESSRSPQPGIADIAGAVEHSSMSGTPTELIIDGHERPLAAGVELAAFRIVQEALTNVRKHAGQSASATVRMSYADDTVAIEIVDDGRGAVSSLNGSGGGNGLIGIRERVEIYGGEFSSGPRTGGGYSVTAELPIANTAGRPSVSSSAAPDREGTT